MTQIVSNTPAIAQWRDLIIEAEEIAHRTLNETLESYLVFTLTRFTTRPHLLSNTMALQFLNGLKENGKQRHEELRDVGDQCLLVSGLFPQNAQRRLVRISYFVNLGRSAYQQIHEEQPQSSHSLFGQLAEDFVSMMDVLLAVRSIDDTWEHLTPIEAYELWEDTGSQHAHQTLFNNKTTTAIKTSTDKQRIKH